MPIAATESGASWLAERALMMPFGLCMCRATWFQPRAAADGAPQENPVSNRGPSIRHGKKDIVGERGLLKTAFPMKFANGHFSGNVRNHEQEGGAHRSHRASCDGCDRLDVAHNHVGVSSHGSRAP